MEPTIVHVLGTGSGAGKSSLCLGLLAWLLDYGVPAKELAYIKPMTQCIDPQPVASFCDQHNIACQAVGPVIFSKGFTREFLVGNTQSRDHLFDEILSTMNALAAGKRFLFVDGVGHPAVGSTIGLSNIDLTRALNDPIVLLVAQPGIGVTIDRLTLCLSYLKLNGISKVGVLLNKISGSLASEMHRFIQQTIGTTFREVELYGCLPKLQSLCNVSRSFDSAVVAAWIEENISAERILFRR